MSAARLLDVSDLNVSFTTRDGPVYAVKNLAFSLAPGEVLGIVGESGSGKTQAAMAVIQPAPTFWRAEEYHQRYLEKNSGAACSLGHAGGGR